MEIHRGISIFIVLILAFHLSKGKWVSGKFVHPANPVDQAVENLHNKIKLEKKRAATVDWRDGISGETNPMLLMSKVVAGREEQFKEIVRPLFKKMEKEDELDQFITALASVQSIPEPDSTMCTLCTTFISALKIAGVTGVVTYDNMYGVLDGICRIAAPIIYGQLLINSGDLCPGILDTQGTMAFDSITRIYPLTDGRKHCEFLNICFADGLPNSLLPPGATLPPLLVGLLPFTIPGWLPIPLAANEANIQKLESMVHGEEAKQAQAASKYVGAFDRAAHVKVLQLTDIHLEPLYTEGTDTDCRLPVCCLGTENLGSGSAGPYGEYSCNTAPRTLDLFLDKVNEIDPDVIIYSGDSSPDKIWDETALSKLNATRQVLDAFTRKIPGRKVYPVIGNSELFPSNVYYQELGETQQANTNFANWWSGLAGFSSSNRGTVEDGAYYSVLLQPGLRLLAYNTNNMHTMNWYAPHSDNFITIPFFGPSNAQEDMEDFMIDTLSDARRDGEKVIMVGHQPPGGNDFIVQYAKWLVNDVLLPYSDVITLHVAGHTHYDEFRLVIDEQTGEAKQMIFVAPSISPHDVSNPAMRVYYLEQSSFELVDYENYFLNLEQVSGVTPVPDIELMYRATDEYGLADLSPLSWQYLVYKMAVNEATLTKHRTNYFSRSPAGGACPDLECRISHLCRLSHTNIQDYNHCVSTYTLPTTTPAPVTDPSSTMSITTTLPLTPPSTTSSSATTPRTATSPATTPSTTTPSTTTSPATPSSTTTSPATPPSTTTSPPVTPSTTTFSATTPSTATSPPTPSSTTTTSATTTPGKATTLGPESNVASQIYGGIVTVTWLICVSTLLQ